MNQFTEYTDFVESMAVYPREYAVIYPALGLAGEAGEIAEKVKKWLRDEDGHAAMGEERRDAILKELGDPLWYITAIASDLGATLQDVVDINVEKLTSRKDRGMLQGSGDNR